MADVKARPRQRPPTHPGISVKHALEDLGLSVRQAALAMGVTPAHLGHIVAEKAKVSADMALRLGVYFGNGPEIWLGMQQDVDLWHTRAALAETLKGIKPAPKAA